MSQPLKALSPNFIRVPNVGYVAPLVYAGEPPCTGAPFVESDITMQALGEFVVNLSFPASGNNGAVSSYLWEFVDGPTGYTVTTNSGGPTQRQWNVTVNKQGTYYVRITVADACYTVTLYSNGLFVANDWVSASIECRTKSSTATLVGFDEYSSASTPPKKYRTQTLSGTLRYCQGQSPNNPDCSGNFNDSTRDDYSGSYEYSVVDGSQTNNQLRARYGRGGPAAACGSGEVFQSNNVPAQNFTVNDFTTGCFPLVSSTQTQKTWQGQGCGCTGTSFYESTTGTVTATLSNEDVETDAIARANVMAVWSAWSAGSPTSCMASIEQRSGYSFLYQTAEYRITKSGLAPNTNYDIRFNVLRRTYGGGAYSFYQTLMVSATTDGSGNLSYTNEVPSYVGFDSYIENAEVKVA